MKLRIEAEEGEIAEKAFDLAKALLEKLLPHDPRLAKALDAIESTPSPVDRMPALKDLLDEANRVYAEEMHALEEDIRKVLE